MKTAQRTITATLITTAAAAVLAGCTTYEPRTVPAATVPIGVPAASPATTTVVVPPTGTATRVTYPEGAYELRGYGTPASPYYWVWLPHGVQAPMIPPPPPLPRAR